MDSILLIATEDTPAAAARFTYPDTPTAVQAEMAKALRSNVHVWVMVDPKSEQRQQFEAALSRAGVPSEDRHNITFVNVSHCDIWARDTGPIWLRRRNDWPSGSARRMMVKPEFTLWGYLVGDHVRGPWAKCDVPNTVPDQLSDPLGGIPVEWATDFITEGGDKSFNGKVRLSSARWFRPIALNSNHHRALTARHRAPPCTPIASGNRDYVACC